MAIPGGPGVFQVLVRIKTKHSNLSWKQFFGSQNTEICQFCLLKIGGSNSGSCASGFGVCCVCKYY